MLLLFHIHLHNLYHYYQEVLHPQLFPHYWLGLPPLLSFLPSGQVGKPNCSTGCNEGDDVGGTGPSPAWRRLFPVFLCYIHLRPFQGIYDFPLSTDPLLCLPGSINLHLEATLNIIGLLSDLKNI